jgi:hypothetical protein
MFLFLDCLLTDIESIHYFKGLRFLRFGLVWKTEKIENVADRPQQNIRLILQAHNNLVNHRLFIREKFVNSLLRPSCV